MRKNFLRSATLVALGCPRPFLPRCPTCGPSTDRWVRPSGPTINSVSVYTGVYSLGSPTQTSWGEPTSPVSVGTLFLGGATSDVGYYFSGPQNPGGSRITPWHYSGTRSSPP